MVLKMLDLFRRTNMDKINKETLDLTKENIKILKELFPNIITDGKIDFDQLKTVLGEEIYESNERYQFTWNGKKDSIKLAQTTSTGTLKPSKDDSVNWDTTENLYIEGDNLEVLKQLQKTYFGKIKMIYIDPPYNTGGDFVYKDNFRDNIKNYKELTNQQLRSNPETSGRYHTDWLNMMYPRLMLARNLLTDDGVIFVSIDENEVENLKKMMDEIFGEMNYIGSYIWENRTTPNDPGTNFAMTHENIIIYGKVISKVRFLGVNKDTSNYKNPDKDINGPWIKDNPSAASGSEKDKFIIKNPFTKEEYSPPKGRYWAFSEKRVNEWSESGKLVFPKVTGKNFYIKKYLKDLKSSTNPESSLIKNILTMHGTKEFKGLFAEGSEIFKYPKPTLLLTKLINQTKTENSIILDFFSGSATTAHAVMKLNAEDGGNRKFIMVQLPEKTDESSEAYKAGYENICEIGKERIRRAGKQIKEELEKEGKDTSSLDIGFKVFKLDETNIKEWDAYEEVTEQTLFNQEQVLKDGRSKDDLLYEILLKYGVFDKKVKEITVNNKKMVSVGENSVILDLSDSISLDDVKAITQLKPMTVIFYEDGFEDDNVKINAEVILKDHSVEDVRSV